MSYDKSADVLYITFEPAPAGSCLYAENENGDILRLDRQSGKVIGVTLPFFAERCKRGEIVVPEVGAVPFNSFAELVFQ